MIVEPATKEEWSTLAHFLHTHAGAEPSMNMRLLGWVTDDQVRMVVGFNGFMGKSCQIHVAMEYGYTFTPRIMLHKVFDFAFNKLGMELLIGTVNSNDEEVMKYDLHLGFKEMFRIPKTHNDDGDIVLLGMRRADCRYIFPVIDGFEIKPKPAVISRAVEV